MSDNDMIRRGDAKQCCTDELRNTMQLLSNPPQSSAAWDARNAINAIPAVQPTVKPLVWRDDGTNGHETDHAFGFYEVYPSPEGDMLSRDGVDSGVFPTLEAAKAAAQADYEDRIMSALDMQPTVKPLRYIEPEGETLDQMRDHARQHPLAQSGDMRLVWVNEGDLHMHTIFHAALIEKPNAC